MSKDNKKQYIPLREQIKNIYDKLPALKGLTKDEKDLIKWAVRGYEMELIKDEKGEENE